MAQKKPEIVDVGFSTVSDPGEAIADVVFVHGLGGHPEETWTRKLAPVFNERKRIWPWRRRKSRALEENAIFWPFHLLSTHPALVKVRILTWGFNSHVVRFWEPNNQQNISGHGNDLLVALERERKDNPSRPLLFVAHSLGGILVKKALENSRASRHQPNYMQVYQSTKGIIFLGTPHRGSEMASWGLLASNLAKFALRGRNKDLLRGLAPHNELLENLNKSFRQILEDGGLHIHCFYEARAMTGLYGLQDLVVPKHSATMDHEKYETTSSIDANHSEICKFSNDSDPGYKAIVGVLKDYLNRAIGESANGSEPKSNRSTLLEQTFAVIDHSIDLSAPKAASITLEKTYHCIPYPKNALYVARVGVLAKMKEDLVPRSPVSTGLRSFALHGMPGVGKTQTALDFVYNNLTYFRAVFWISASTEQKTLQGFVEIARLLDLSKGIASPEPLESVEAVKRWLGETRVRWLLVFDNVDDLKMLNRYWPLAGHGSILVTSQNPSSEYNLAHRGAKVEPFSEQESLQFLDTSLGRYLGRFDKEAATRLARALGCHPLALTQIASFILESSSSIAAVLEMFKEHEEAQKLLDMEHGSLWYSDTVAAAFELSISRLNENTRRTMGVLCFFDPDSIPEELLIPKANSHHNQLLSYLSSPLNRGVLIKDLRRFSLISKNMETQILAIHRLVQEVVLKQLRRDRGHRKISFETALQLLRGKFPLHSLSRDHMTEAWPQCEVYLPHVLAFHENYRRLAHEGGLDISSEFIELMYSCAWYLCERGRFELSNPLIKTVKDEYQKISLQDHGLLWADICTVQLFEHNEMSQMDDAERVASEALDIREKAVQSGLLDEYHPNRANGFMNLGVVIANRDAQYAIQLHQKALDIRCGSDKYTDHQIHGLSLNYLNIGRCFWMTGDLAQAEAAFQNCLTMIKKREEMRGHRFIVSAWAYWALGNIAIDKGDIENALRLHTQSMILTQEILGLTHLKTAACFHKVACLLQKTGESNRAINLLELALDVYEKRSIDVRSEKARTKYKLAQILRLSSSLPSSRWQELESDAYRHYEEITGALPSRTLLEADFDDLVAYFYR